MLDQVLVSSVLRDYLQQHYPAFLADAGEHPNGSMDCSLKSPSRHFSIWIGTYNCEYTVGLESPDGDSGCHTHFTPYTAKDFDHVLGNMSALIDDIMSGKVVFYHSSLGGYTWTSDVDDTLKKKKPNEEIMYFSWK